MKIYPRNTLRLMNEKSKHLFDVFQDWIVTIAGMGDDVIKKGFWSDLASIPKWLWWLYAPIEYREEGVLHDWLYYKQEWGGKPITRKQADKVLYYFVEQRHGKTTANNFYYAVKFCGFNAWNKYKKDRSKK
jgi:hypothetical protein